MKAPLRTFEYMRWVMGNAPGARYDLASSGVRGPAEDFTDSIPVASLLRDPDLSGHADALAHAIAHRYGVTAEQVIPTLGANLAITQVMLALIRSGDHLIVERPTYEALHRVPGVLGADVSRLERRFEEGWAVVPERLAQLLTPKTRAVVLSNLHNPSGTGMDRDTVEQVAELAARVSAVVIVDEVYLDFAADEDPKLVAGATVGANVVSLSSMSKVLGFVEPRFGWIVAGDPNLSRALRAAADYLHVLVPPGVVHAARAAMARWEAATQHARSLASAGRQTVTRWLETEPRVTWTAPNRGLTGLLKLPTFVDDLEFSAALRARFDTQVVPGAMFEAPGFVRISFGLPRTDLEQGLANLSAMLDEFPTDAT